MSTLRCLCGLREHGENQRQHVSGIEKGTVDGPKDNATGCNQYYGLDTCGPSWTHDSLAFIGTQVAVTYRGKKTKNYMNPYKK